MTTEQEIGLIPRGRKTFSQIDYSALDRETIEQALTDFVLANFPDQQDVVQSSGFRIIARQIAYVADALSYRADYLANNAYLPTVTNLRALDNLLTLIGYRRSSVTAAVADVAIIPKEVIGIAPTFDANGNVTDPGDNKTVHVPARTPITGVGSNGKRVRFELFPSPDNIFDDIVIPAGQSNVIAHAVEGESKTFRDTSNGERFMQLVLPDLNVVQDSLRVNVGIFDETDPNRGTPYEPNDELLPEWERVDFLVTRGAEDIYEVKLRNDGLTVITFGDGTFGNTIPKGHDIIVNYRVGGGERGNVLPDALTAGGNFFVYQGDLRTSETITVNMRNVTRGVGGRDEEGIEEAKFLAPLVYQAQNRAVKDIDYAAFAVNHPKVSKAVAVSRQPIVIDANEDLGIYEFPLAETIPYTLQIDVHRFDLRETQTHSAQIQVPRTSYSNVDTMLIELNEQLGWVYDPDALAFREENLGQGFVAYFDKSIEGFIELWINTGDYQARATIKETANSLFPILRFVPGTYGRVDANYVDLHILSFAEDGTVAVPNLALVNELRTYFRQFQEIQTEIIIRRGFIRRVDITGHVYIERSADPIQTKLTVDNAIKNLFAADNRELGEPLYISKIFEAIEAVEGVAYLDQFSPAQNVFPDDKTLLQLGTVTVDFFEAR